VFHVNNHKQGNIVDPWAQIGPKRKKLLEGSWAKLFQQEILLKLPVESLRKHYHDWNERIPSIPRSRIAATKEL